MIADLGLIDYEEAYKVQKEFVARRKLGEIGDSLILAEHKAVFTIGRSGRIENLIEDEEALAVRGIKVLHVDRGGDITFHGPGQLVIYPIIDLRARGRDLHRYMRDIEGIVIDLLKGFTVLGRRSAGKTGVWVSGKKIASIGIAASNWVTFHGVSLNVNCDLSFFDMIHPCGLRGARVTSLAEVLGRDLDMSEVKKSYINAHDAVLA